MKDVSKAIAFVILSSLLLTVISFSQTTNFPVKRIENAESWKRDGEAAIAKARAMKPRKRRAKNVILFVGDGMGISTITASRILEGQLRGESGEENRLSFEAFPYVALSKTYSANQQTSDSAPTMSAIITGAKTDEGTLSVNQNVVHGDYKTVKGNETQTLLELAESRGLSTGVVTTTRVTHATPAACYAHTADRDWESDKDISDRSKVALEAKFPDIARQLVEFPYGDGLEVALGGGRQKFLPNSISDPEYSSLKGERLDGRNLIEEWKKRFSNSNYVWNKRQFDEIDPRKTKHLLGLFEPSHMQYEHDRAGDSAGEPSLAEMTSKAIDILSQSKKGFFLMVEGGRIDHGHHAGNSFRALRDTIELSDAVQVAQKKINFDETLIIVTADHSHTLTISGYAARGNNILGLVYEIDSNGNRSPIPQPDALGLPYTSLGYANGRGYTGENANSPEGPKTFPSTVKGQKGITKGRPDLSKVDTTDPNYLQEATVPLGDETHGGEDVAIFANGAGAHLVHGVMEENWIYFVMKEAMRLK